MKKIGYARVSTGGQDLGQQMEALKKAGCDIIYSETASGGKKHRPELDKCLTHLKPGDELLITKLDRLGRKVIDLHQLVNDLQMQGITFKSLGDGFDLATPYGRAMFGMMAVFAELERDLIRERTRETLAHLRASGIQLGRRQNDNVKNALIMITQGMTRKQVITATGISRATYYRILGNL